MAQPDTRKYQLFPKDRQPPALAACGKQLEPEQSSSVAVGQTQEKSEQTSITNNLRQRIKEHNLNRRRKVSVPELGPMTTVQEVAMDSPTIPGRPALHERSISSPVQSTRYRHLATLRTIHQASKEDNAAAHIAAPISAFRQDRAPESNAPRHPLSPKDLTPLVIPKQPASLPQLNRKISINRLKSSKGPQDSQNLATKPEDSPKARTPFTPFTPMSGSLPTATPRSATTALTASTLPTPISAPAESRGSPRPWEKSTTSSPDSASHPTADVKSSPKAELEHQSRNGPVTLHNAQSLPAMSHKRGKSESGSIMDCGRSRRRCDGSSGSKRSMSAERRAFETLPQGWKSSEAVSKMDQAEIGYLQRQAVGQASRFEVLRKEDVDDLSKANNRTEYLRRTYMSLRAGRRNLHSRICQYLRSARVAKFSYESMLKQEEALAELDASIDDWVNKLEQAENRRTRVRQKLLEHVAAAATLPNVANNDDTTVGTPLQKTTGVHRPSAASDLSTPPQSPTKMGTFFDAESPSSSPQRVVARVPSVIPELPAEEGESTDSKYTSQNPDEVSVLKRMESIRIYADSDVYALLADVENEFTNLHEGGHASPQLKPHPPTDEDRRRELHRAQSHDILSGGSKGTVIKSQPASPPATSQPAKESTSGEGDIFLTAAVFKPE
ncbi:hypothetical protein DL767_001504 [Monosporascus sp. MG133]|nr:hypothetical protein DL767_001504 [Monosporascus sp. MG133]